MFQRLISFWDTTTFYLSRTVFYAIFAVAVLFMLAYLLPELFTAAISKINPGVAANEIEKLLEELVLKLDYDDLGQAFYKELTKTSGIKLIDFKITFQFQQLNFFFFKLFQHQNSYHLKL